MSENDLVSSDTDESGSTSISGEELDNIIDNIDKADIVVTVEPETQDKVAIFRVSALFAKRKASAFLAERKAFTLLA